MIKSLAEYVRGGDTFSVGGSTLVVGGSTVFIGESTLAIHDGRIGKGGSVNADFWLGFFAGWLVLISVLCLCGACYEGGFSAAKEGR